MATKKQKAPLTRCDGMMTESAYLAWIRSTLRSKSLRWPPRNNALHAARRAYVGPNKLQKWEFSCAICQTWFKAKEVVVDHFPIAAGSILKVEDIGRFCENLYCGSENLRVLCVPCHDIHSLADKNGISFEEAKVEKEIIAVCKQKTTALLDFLASYGHTGASVSNQAKRVALVSTIIKEKYK